MRKQQKPASSFANTLRIGVGIACAVAFCSLASPASAQATVPGLGLLDALVGSSGSSPQPISSKVTARVGSTATYFTSGTLKVSIGCSDKGSNTYGVEQVINPSSDGWRTAASTTPLIAGSENKTTEVGLVSGAFQQSPEMALSAMNADGGLVTLQTPTVGVEGSGKDVTCFIQQPATPTLSAFGTLQKQFEALSAQVTQLDGSVKRLAVQSPAPAASGAPIPNADIDELKQKLSELEKRPTVSPIPVVSDNPQTQKQIEDLRAQVERLQQQRLTDEDTSAEQAAQIAAQSASGPYPAPDQVLPAVDTASEGVASQVQAAGPSTTLGLATSNGKLVSDGSAASAFELALTKGENKNLLVVKNGDQTRFVIDAEGRITSQSVTTASLGDRAVTSAKLRPGRIDFTMDTGDDYQTDSPDFIDFGNGYEYQVGPTDEVLTLNGRLMGRNPGNGGVGARIVATHDGKTLECNESFSYTDDWSVLSIPCSLEVPANAKIVIKWQVKTGEGGTAAVFRKSGKTAPYINGFASAK